jgi:hypothetical protein
MQGRRILAAARSLREARERNRRMSNTCTPTCTPGAFDAGRAARPGQHSARARCHVFLRLPLQLHVAIACRYCTSCVPPRVSSAPITNPTAAPMAMACHGLAWT